MVHGVTSRHATGIAIAAATVLAVLAAAPVAGAQNPGVVVEDGVTQPVFGYADAIRSGSRRISTPTWTASRTGSRSTSCGPLRPEWG
jgi:hypothetical protein